MRHCFKSRRDLPFVNKAEQFRAFLSCLLYFLHVSLRFFGFLEIEDFAVINILFSTVFTTWLTTYLEVISRKKWFAVRGGKHALKGSQAMQLERSTLKYWMKMRTISVISFRTYLDVEPMKLKLGMDDSLGTLYKKLAVIINRDAFTLHFEVFPNANAERRIDVAFSYI